MKSRRWSSRVLGKYILLQLPSLALVVVLLMILHNTFNFPLSYAGAVILIWVAKDAILYPFVWRAYDSILQEPMVGLFGKAKDIIDPSGYIEIKGELWKAELAEGDTGIRKGEQVEVLGIRGLTLIVKARDAAGMKNP